MPLATEQIEKLTVSNLRQRRKRKTVACLYRVHVCASQTPEKCPLPWSVLLMYETCLTHRVNSRVGVYLQSVNVITRVLEQAVIWVQHLM